MDEREQSDVTFDFRTDTPPGKGSGRLESDASV